LPPSDHDAEVPIIICSGYATDTTVAELLATGGEVRFLAKPFLPDDLLAVVSRATEGRAAPGAPRDATKRLDYSHPRRCAQPSSEYTAVG
jgi:DNA-binding NtrC family response regulator